MEIRPKVEVFPSCDILFNQMGGQIKPKRILDTRPKISNGQTVNGTGNGVTNGANGTDIEPVKTNGPKVAN
jgi:hypothetical protein